MARKTKGKLKKIKLKTHKASAKRFKVTASGLVEHRGQGDNGHSKNYEGRREKRNPRQTKQLGAKGEIKKIKQLLGKA